MNAFCRGCKCRWYTPSDDLYCVHCQLAFGVYPDGQSVVPVEVPEGYQEAVNETTFLEPVVQFLESLSR